MSAAFFFTIRLGAFASGGKGEVKDMKLACTWHANTCYSADVWPPFFFFVFIRPGSVSIHCVHMHRLETGPHTFLQDKHARTLPATGTISLKFGSNPDCAILIMVLISVDFQVSAAPAVGQTQQAATSVCALLFFLLSLRILAG